jgi:hypothetical protein
MNIRDGETVVQPETTILNEPISDDIVVLVRLTDRERQGRLSAHLSSANRALKDEFVHAQVEEDDPGNLGLTRFQFRRENVRFEKPGVVILTIEIISSQPHGSESLRVFQTRIHVNENTAAANEARTNGVGPNNSRAYYRGSVTGGSSYLEANNAIGIFEERHSNEALPEENTHERD